MSQQDKPAQFATGADEQSPTAITNQHSYLKRRRSADNTIKDQDAVRDYLTFKQTRGLMTESEKRLLDKIAAVCGMHMPIDALQTVQIRPIQLMRPVRPEETARRSE